jgi:hypothetical protein
VPLDLTGSPPEALLPIVLGFFSPADFISFLFEFGEPGGKFVLLIE